MSNNLLNQFLALGDDELPDAPAPTSHSFLWPPALAHFPQQPKVEEPNEDAIPPNWGHLILDSPSSGTSSSLDYDDPTNAATDMPCIPGGLSQISSMHGDSRSPSPDMAGLPGAFFTQAAPQHQNIPSVTLRPATIALNPTSLHTRALSPPVVHRPSPSPVSKPKRGAAAAQAPVPVPPHQQPHPYSISPSNTTALFTRASSVSSIGPGVPVKKSRAPPSGPISTKDFIPPDVSGLSKREARLVKNRAAAFLSRQRKREEFEHLESRVDVLEADNARLYQELESYRSGDVPEVGTAPSSTALTAEVTALRRELATRDADIAKMNANVKAGVQEQLAADRQLLAQKDAEIAELRRMLTAGTAIVKKEEDCDESDSEDAQSTVGGKKDLKSAGSMAFMVLLFSLSTLLTNASGESTHAKAPKAPQPVRRPGFHRRSDSNLGFPFTESFNVYESFAGSSSLDSMLSSPSFGYDEDTLMGGSTAASASALHSGGLSPASAFAGLSASSSFETLQQATGSAISSVKSIGPNEFEFDFDVPAASGSSSPKKIAVRVKSALPLDLDLNALNKAKATQTAPSTSTGVFASTLPSPFEFRPDDDLDFTFPTAPSTASDSKKRKRVVVEIQPSAEPPNKRRASEERWDVHFTEDLGHDEDVTMRS